MNSCTKNIRYINEHQSFFKANNLFPMDEFKNIVSTTPNALIECSSKVSKNIVYSNRFNLWFPKPNSKDQVNTAMNFLGEIEKTANIHFDMDLFYKFYDSGFKWSGIRYFVIGLDIREDFFSSRLKIWFILSNYNKKKELAINLYGNLPEIRSLFFHDEIIVGFDFFFDGRSIIKLYPDIIRQELDNKLILNKAGKILHPKALELAKDSYWMHIYYSRNNNGRILQLHTKNMEPFLKLLPDNEEKLFRKLCNEKKLPCAIFAFNEDDIIKNEIETWSFYYMPQCVEQLNLLI